MFISFGYGLTIQPMLIFHTQTSSVSFVPHPPPLDFRCVISSVNISRALELFLSDCQLSPDPASGNPSCILLLSSTFWIPHLSPSLFQLVSCPPGPLILYTTRYSFTRLYSFHWLFLHVANWSCTLFKIPCSYMLIGLHAVHHIAETFGNDWLSGVEWARKSRTKLGRSTLGALNILTNGKSLLSTIFVFCFNKCRWLPSGYSLVTPILNVSFTVVSYMFKIFHNKVSESASTVWNKPVLFEGNILKRLTLVITGQSSWWAMLWLPFPPPRKLVDDTLSCCSAQIFRKCQKET